MAGRLEDQIFVRQLGYDTTDEDLMGMFEPFGPIKRASVARNKDTGVSRGFGFVAFALGDDAARAVESLRGKKLNGKAIQIEFAAKRGHVVDDKPAPKTGVIGERDEAERARHEARKARALRTKSSKAETEMQDEGNAISVKDEADAVGDKSSLRIVHPDGVKPGMVLLLLGVPAALKKRDLMNVIKKICRKTEVELVKSGHYLLESLQVVYPAGKVFELTAPSRPACAKLIAALNNASPHSLGLKPEADETIDTTLNTLIPQVWKDKLFVRTLSQLTQPQFRKRHCRLIVRNLSFQANEANVADKLGRYGPLAEVTLPLIESETDGVTDKRRRGKEGPRVRSRGFAFVTFLCASDALNATQNSAASTDGRAALKICNREVAVDFCQSKDRFLEGPALDTEGGASAAMEVEKSTAEESADQNKDSDEVGEDSDEGEEDSNEDENSSDDEIDNEDSGTEHDTLVSSGNSNENQFSKSNSDNKSDEPEEDVSQGRTIFLRGLSLDAQVQDIQKALHPFGKLELALLVKDKKTGEPRGSAFVKFSSSAEAQACFESSKRGVGIIVADRSCVVALAVARDEAERLKSEGKGRIDRRHLYLANEGLALGKAEDIVNMPEDEKEKRRMAQAEKKKKLVNPLFAVSALRLSIRNLHKGITDVQLRELCITATKKGIKRSLASKADIERLLGADGIPSTQKTLVMPEFGLGGKREIPSCKVMLDLQRVRGGLPQSRGYGFVEFKHHAHALACLRELNQNVAYSSSAAVIPPAKDATVKLKSTLIVEFSLENMQKVKILQERESRRAEQRNLNQSANDEFSKKRSRSNEASDNESNEESDANNDDDNVNDDDVNDDENDADEKEDIPRSASGKSQTPAARKRRQDQRRREKQGRRLKRKEGLAEIGEDIPDAPKKTEKKRGGLFSRIRDKKKAKKNGATDSV